MLLLCFVLLWLYQRILVDFWYSGILTDILQGCCSGAGAVTWLPQCHWTNLEKYGYDQAIPNQNNIQWIVKMCLWFLGCTCPTYPHIFCFYVWCWCNIQAYFLCPFNVKYFTPCAKDIASLQTVTPRSLSWRKPHERSLFQMENS